MSMKGEIPGFGDVQIQLLIEDAIQMLYSVKSSDSDGGASILRLVFCKYIASEPHKRLRISTDYEAINATHSAPAAFVVQLLSLLRRHVNIAEKDLAASISAHPMHGLFLALASILREVKYHNIKEKAEIETWNRILLDAYDLVHTATKTVLVVLSNESPEGNYPGLNPEENGVGGGEDFDAVIGEGGGDTVSKSQRILHECFRTVKEACSALQVVLCKPPLPREGNEVQFVKLDTIVAAGDWLRLLLTSIRHFGAFSGVYTCFHCLCATLLCSKIPSLVTLPQGWLEEFLHKAEVMDVSITRRSGGLPLGVLGVLSANSPYRTSLLEKTMKRLFEAAKAALPLDADTNLDLPQVHAYNIIRRLLSDATITDLMRDYFSDCFVLCIDGLSSQSFPIRNCATMLFSSLVTKVLGVKKNRDEDHAINTVTGREFFARFPSLHAFMIQKLTAAVYELEGENYSVHPAFYPILTILARLKPTTVEGNNTHLTLSTFRPLVLKCAASSFYKVREITARAYASLIPPAEFVDEVHHLMTSIQSNSPSSTHPNLIHGILMIVRNLVQVHLHRDVAGTDILLDFASKIPALMRTSIWILTDLNIPAIQDAYISFIRDFLAKRDWLPTASSLNNPLVQVYIKESWSISVQLLHHYDMTDLKLAHAWIFNLRKNLAQYILECLGPLDTSFESKSAIILRFLCDVDYEVQLEALQHLSLAVFAESVEWSRILPKLLEMVHSKSSYEQVTYVAAEILASEAIREHFRSCSFASVKSVPAGSVADDLAERLSVTENTYEVAALLPLLTTLVVERDDGGGEAGVQVLVGLMRKWSFDETATYVRASVAKSLYVLLSKFSGALSQNVASELLYVDLLLLLDQLLDDDDADVRAVAAKIAAEHLNSKTPIVPLQCRSLLFKYALRSVSSLPAISKVAEYALQILAGSIDPVIVLEAQLNPSHVLFAKEEFNQNKEEIIDAVLAYQVLMAAVGHTAVTLQAKESLYKRVMEWSQSTVATLAATGSKLSTLKGQGKVFGLLMRTVISLVFACSFSDNSRAQTLMKQVASMDVHEQVLRIAKSGSMDAFDGFIPV
ncbi:putative death-receptor fusion protein-domain-containing protein [Chytriomyces sp. MP71]|nr:putative death-receptor fusion protein-domain-containing protein [Chytriomyces sp. MP71]